MISSTLTALAIAALTAEPLPEGCVARLGSGHFRPARYEHHIWTYSASATFSDDGKRLLVTAHPFGLAVFDTDTGRPLRRIGEWEVTRLSGISPKARTALTRDGRLQILGPALGATDSRVWDLDDGRRLGTLPGRGYIRATSAGATWTFRAGQGFLNLRTERLHDVVPRLEGKLTEMAFTRDGSTCAFADEHGNVGLCKPPHGWPVDLVRRSRTKSPPNALTLPIRCLAVGGGGEHRIVVIGLYSQLLAYQATDDGWEPRVLIDNAGEYGCGEAAVSPDGKSVAVTNTHFQLIDLESGETRWRVPLSRRPGGGGAIVEIVFTPDGGRIVTLDAISSSEAWLRVWDAETGRVLSEHPGHRTGVAQLAFRPDGRSLVSVGIGRGVCVWDLESGRLTATPRVPAKMDIELLHLGPDGGSLLSLYGHDVLRWRPDGGEPDTVARLRYLTNNSLTALIHDPSGRYAAISNERGYGVLWDTRTGEELGQPRLDESERFRSLAVTSAGDIVAVSVRRNRPPLVRVREAKTGELLWEETLDFPVVKAVCSPDGRYVLTSTGSKEFAGAWLWDLHRNRRFGFRDLRSFTAATFSPDGEMFAAVPLDGSAVHVVESRTGRLIRRIEAPDGVPIHSLAFSPDCRTLATGMGDSTILLWKLVK